MNDIDAAWLAGLLEGEGSFWALRREGRRNLARVSMGSCDLDVLERVQRVTGFGAITKVRRSNRPDRKPHWIWTVQRNNDARQVMEWVLPHMGKRRAAKIRESLADTPVDLSVPYCEKGHDVYDADNVFFRRGAAVCRACNAERLAAGRAAKAGHQPSSGRLSA